MLLFQVQSISVGERGGGGGGRALNKKRGLRQITRYYQSYGPLGLSANKLVIWTTYWVKQKPTVSASNYSVTTEGVRLSNASKFLAWSPDIPEKSKCRNTSSTSSRCDRVAWGLWFGLGNVRELLFYRKECGIWECKRSPTCLQMDFQLLSGLFAKFGVNSEGTEIGRFWAKRLENKREHCPP